MVYLLGTLSMSSYNEDIIVAFITKASGGKSEFLHAKQVFRIVHHCTKCPFMFPSTSCDRRGQS